ncbi:MAG: hypothetical protein CTY20_00965 [Hyphomicrobium sp.]|nr:MAG: hypothetical protein CTY20_00965 [Hyphomicrobium sp.]
MAGVAGAFLLRGRNVILVAVVAYLTAGCSVAKDQLPQLLANLPSQNTDGATQSLQPLTKALPAKVIRAEGSVNAAWPTQCNPTAWPAPIFQSNVSAEAVLTGVAKVAGLGSAVTALQKLDNLANVMTDSEMSVPDQSKQRYIWHALGSEKHLVSPLAAYRFGDFTLAQAKARQEAEQVKSQSGPRSANYAAALGQLAMVHTDTGFSKDNETAAAYWREAISIFRDLRMQDQEGEALVRYGELEARQGRFVAVKQSSDRLLSLSGLPQPTSMRSLALAARVDAFEGRMAAAIQKLGTAHQFWETRKSGQQEANDKLIKQVFIPFAPNNDFELIPELETARVLAQLGEVMQATGRPQLSAILLDKALAKTRATPAHYRPERVDMFIELAEMNALAGKIAEARAGIKTARNMNRWNLVLYNRAVANQKFAEGVAALEQNDAAAAEAGLRGALAWWQGELGAAPDALRPATKLAQLYLAQKNSQLADQYARQAACFADATRGATSFSLDGRAGQAVREANETYLEAALAGNLNPGDRVALAFKAAQGAARGTSSRGIEAGLLRLSSRDPKVADLLSKRHKLSSDLERGRRQRAAQSIAQSGLYHEVKQAALKEGGKDPQTQAILLSRTLHTDANGGPAVAVDQVAAELDRVNEQLASVASTGAMIASRDVSIDQLRQVMAADEVFVQYLVANRKTFIVAFDRKSALVAEAAIGKRQLAGAVARLRQSLEGEGRKPFDDAQAAELYNVLLQPVAELLPGKKRITVVKDGALSGIPFALLRAGTPVSPWLIETFAVSTYPSASALWLARKQVRPSQAKRPFLGIGNPELPGSTGAPALSGLALPKSAAPTIADSLRPIPATEGEVKAFAHIFGAGADSLLLRQGTSEKRLRQMQLADYRVISFATHGLMPGETIDNEEAAIVLSSPFASKRDDEDGVLTSSEIAALRLDADLVILSACNTAAGNDAFGTEKLGGLARAFFAAGARSMLVTHWSVNDFATRELMTKFAASFRQNAGKSQALQSAMTALIKADGGKFAHPFYWASFDLIGS